MAYSDNSKQWFETGDYPTQAQFAQVFDWLRWKDEQLGVADINGLVGYLNNIAPTLTYEFDVNGSYIIPAGYSLVKIYAKTPIASTFQIGDTVGGEEQVGALVIAANITLAVVVEIPADANKTIYFNVPVIVSAVTTVVKIYLQKI